MAKNGYNFGREYLIRQEDLVMRRFYKLVKKLARKKAKREQSNKRSR
jgi:hypothetical protein